MFANKGGLSLSGTVMRDKQVFAGRISQKVWRQSSRLLIYHIQIFSKGILSQAIKQTGSTALAVETSIKRHLVSSYKANGIHCVSSGDQFCKRHLQSRCKKHHHKRLVISKQRGGTWLEDKFSQRMKHLGKKTRRLDNFLKNILQHSKGTQCTNFKLVFPAGHLFSTQQKTVCF